MATYDPADEQLLAIFGTTEFPDDFPGDRKLRGVRLKVSPGGGLTLAHPEADGPHIIKIQQVPGDVPASEVLRRMQTVAVTRRNKTIHWEEIRPGAILS